MAGPQSAAGPVSRPFLPMLSPLRGGGGALALQPSFEFNTLTPIGGEESEPSDYPVSLLPPSMQYAVNAIVLAADCHPNAASHHVVGAAAAAAMGVAEVETLGVGNKAPCSLYLHQIAPSGLRKSTILRLAWRGITDADIALQDAHAERVKIASDIRKENAKSKNTDPAAVPEHRLASTIMQRLTEPTMEALTRDAGTGYPFPVIASAEAGAFYAGYSAGGESSARSLQTATLLAAGYGSEYANIPRIGDGTAPNRVLREGSYVFGICTSVQNASMGYDLIFGELSVSGLCSRMLVSECPATPTHSPPDADQSDAITSSLADWAARLRNIRALSDPEILNSERGAPPRALLTISDMQRNLLAQWQQRWHSGFGGTPVTDALANRLPEQALRLAAVMQIIDRQCIQSLQQHPRPLDNQVLADAMGIVGYHAQEYIRIAKNASASDLDNACREITAMARRWEIENDETGKAPRGFYAADRTFTWSVLVNRCSLTRPRGGRYSQNSEFKLLVKQRLLDLGIIATAGSRVVLNPEWQPD